jgi:hypothetical protein
MSTESNLDYKKNSKLTLSYKGVDSDTIRSITGYIKKVEGVNLVIHNKFNNTFINFNVETKDGKKLDKSNDKISEIDVKTFKEWKYENEVHIALPTADDIESKDTYPISVTGSVDNRYNIDFRSIIFNVNGHKIGLINQKEGSKWKITHIKLSDDNDDEIVDCGFHSVVSDYTVFYVATQFKIGVFSINNMNR